MKAHVTNSGLKCGSSISPFCGSLLLLWRSHFRGLPEKWETSKAGNFHLCMSGNIFHLNKRTIEYHPGLMQCDQSRQLDNISLFVDTLDIFDYIHSFLKCITKIQLNPLKYNCHKTFKFKEMFMVCNPFWQSLII